MNIKQFLVLKICSNLPYDITDIVWKKIQDEAADSIRKMYEFKVKRNIGEMVTYFLFDNY